MRGSGPELNLLQDQYTCSAIYIEMEDTLQGHNLSKCLSRTNFHILPCTLIEIELTAYAISLNICSSGNNRNILEGKGIERELLCLGQRPKHSFRRYWSGKNVQIVHYTGLQNKLPCEVKFPAPTMWPLETISHGLQSTGLKRKLLAKASVHASVTGAGLSTNQKKSNLYKGLNFLVSIHT